MKIWKYSTFASSLMSYLYIINIVRRKQVRQHFRTSDALVTICGMLIPTI